MNRSTCGSDRPGAPDNTTSRAAIELLERVQTDAWYAFLAEHELLDEDACLEYAIAQQCEGLPPPTTAAGTAVWLQHARRAAGYS